MTHKEALKKAADDAFDAGKITSAERSELAILATQLPPMHEGAGAIDWANLVSQIQTLLPLILQIIAMFKKPA